MNLSEKEASMGRKGMVSVAATLVCVSFLVAPSAEGTKVLVEKPAVQPAPGQPVAYQPVDTEALAGLGATILAEYPFFYLADVPLPDLTQFLEAAQARGFAVAARESFDEIRVNGYTFPSSGPLPELPPDLTLADYPGPTGLYLVQTVGPNRAEWEKALNQIGGTHSLLRRQHVACTRRDSTGERSPSPVFHSTCQRLSTRVQATR
jgi:hypothetical protein